MDKDKGQTYFGIIKQLQHLFENCVEGGGKGEKEKYETMTITCVGNYKI